MTDMQRVRELLLKYLNSQIEAGNFSYYAELSGDLALTKYHAGRRDVYDEVAADLAALLEKSEPEEAGAEEGRE